MDLRLRSSPARFLRCTYCRDEIPAGTATIRCPRCGSLNHVLCARELRTCPTLGCGTSLAHGPLVRPRQTRERARLVARSLASLAGAALLVLLGHAAALTTGARLVLEVPIHRTVEPPPRFVFPELKIATPPEVVLASVLPESKLAVPSEEPSEQDPTNLGLTLAWTDAGTVRATATNNGSLPLVLPRNEWGVYTWIAIHEDGQRFDLPTRFYPWCGTVSGEYVATTSLVTLAPGASWVVDVEEPFRYAWRERVCAGRYSVRLRYRCRPPMRGFEHGPTIAREQDVFERGVDRLRRRALVAQRTSNRVLLELSGDREHREARPVR